MSLTYIKKLRKFKVSQVDKEVTYRRKPKKYKQALYSQNRNTYTFEKAEGIFNRWLEKNKHRLPTALLPKAGYGSYFKGVIKNISLYVNGMPEAMISYDYYGDYKNIAIEDEDGYVDTTYMAYIGDESYHPQKGYYDADRTDGIFTYYPSREELYASEVFERMIEYCNKYITPQNSFYIFNFNNSSSVDIDTTDESKLMRIGMQKTFKDAEFIDGLSEEECSKLVEIDKAYRVIKYELFEPNKEPLIRYIWLDRDKKNDT